MAKEVLPERPAAPSVPGFGGGGLPEGGDYEKEGAAFAVPSVEALGVETTYLSPTRLAIRRFRRHKLAMFSLVVVVLIGLAVLLAPVICKYDYDQILTKDGVPQLQLRPSTAHPFGTDDIGRDQFARVVYGGRVSVGVGFGVAIICTSIGTTIGALAGFYGGKLDNFLMRVTDLLLALPLLVLLIIGSQLLGGSVLDIVLILSLFLWMPLARIVRGLFLSLKEKEFVEAARAVGASNRRIMFRHILPNCSGQIIVNATLTVALAILTESTLSFLGFGIQPPVPTWGNLLDHGRRYTLIAPWLVWFPGLAILLTVLCVNFLGDGLRDALDPTQRRVRS